MVEGRKRDRAGNTTYINGAVFLVGLVLIGPAACRPSEHEVGSHKPSGALTVGFGLTTGQTPQGGIQQVTRNVVLERLVNSARDGRPQAGLFERWSTSPDGLTWRFHLRPGVVFHDGT